MPIALYRGVDLHENDNKLPYVYTCPSPDALIMEGDSAFVLVKPKRITRKERIVLKRKEKKSESREMNGRHGRTSSRPLRRGSIV